METIHKVNNFKSDNTVISTLHKCVSSFLGPLLGRNMTFESIYTR